MKDSLPQFLQKCAQTFDSNCRYKMTYGTSAFGYSWYFTNPLLFLFFFFRFLLDDFDSGSLGFLEVVWFLWK